MTAPRSASSSGSLGKTFSMTTPRRRSVIRLVLQSLIVVGLLLIFPRPALEVVPIIGALIWLGLLALFGYSLLWSALGTETVQLTETKLRVTRRLFGRQQTAEIILQRANAVEPHGSDLFTHVSVIRWLHNGTVRVMYGSEPHSAGDSLSVADAKTLANRIRDRIKELQAPKQPADPNAYWRKIGSAATPKVEDGQA